MGGHPGEDIGRALSARHGPGEDSDQDVARDQWTAVVSDAGSHAISVVSADVCVRDAGSVSNSVG